MEPSLEVLIAIQNLKRSQTDSFDLFVRWITESMLALALASSDNKDKDDMIRSQGRLQVLKIFNLYLTNVDDLILRARENTVSEVSKNILD